MKATNGNLTIPANLAAALEGCAEGEQILVTIGKPTYDDTGALVADVTAAEKVETEEEVEEEVEVPAKKSKTPPVLEELDEE